MIDSFDKKIKDAERISRETGISVEEAYTRITQLNFANSLGFDSDKIMVYTPEEFIEMYGNPSVDDAIFEKLSKLRKQISDLEILINKIQGEINSLTSDIETLKQLIRSGNNVSFEDRNDLQYDKQRLELKNDELNSALSELSELRADYDDTLKILYSPSWNR